MKLQPVPFTQVTFEDTFWAPRQKTNREVTLHQQFEQLTGTGRLNNILKAGGKMQGGFEGYRFNDSDVYKWLEGAAYSLTTHPDPKLEAAVNECIEAIEAAQEPDGYLNSYFTVEHPEQKWQNLSMNHELYCAGHLFEAAVAHYEATGSRRLLDVAVRNADHIASIFGPSKRLGYCGHPEIELALFRLARATGEDKYRELARFFIDARGSRPSPFEAELRDPNAPRNIVDWAGLWFKRGEYEGSYTQDHLPVREQSEVVGHAVRALYLFSGMADLYDWTKDETLLTALHRLWDNLTKKRMYVTGGVGPSASNEGFTRDYDLPNETAYAETCASIALILWAHRMWLIEGKSEYVDVMELALHNGFLSGISLDGTKYFYVNPLAADGTHHRQEWFGCACCPPNITRLLASLGSYAYAVAGDEVWVGMYVQGTARVQAGEHTVTLRQETDYPWSGRVRFRVESDGPAEFGLRLRVPGWSRNAEALTADGWQVADGWAVMRRAWASGDTVEVDFGMTPETLFANPLVRADTGRVAFRMGPIVYCAEQVDNGPGLPFVSVQPKAGVRCSEVLGGVNVLDVEGFSVEPSAWEGKLYAPELPVGAPKRLTLIPYCLWDNRDPGEMEVWLPRR
ncbi:MAG: hypothetical protein AMXMBFR61_02310 [Fimbriimonadales bacterium]